MITSAAPSQSANGSAECLCSYVNTTSCIQVIRIGKTGAYHFERVVFPGDRLLFQAKLNEHLEVLSPYLGQAIKIQKIPCCQLLVQVDEHQLSA